MHFTPDGEGWLSVMNIYYPFLIKEKMILPKKRKILLTKLQLPRGFQKNIYSVRRGCPSTRCGPVPAPGG